MIKSIKYFTLVCVSLFLMSHVYAISEKKLPTSPVGFWQTIDDITGKAKSIVKIEETPEKVLVGRVLKIYPRPGHDQNELCTACKDEKHNQRIVGMIVLEGLKQNQDDLMQWTGGRILDPKNGKTYRSNIRLIAEGQKLSVKGYIGIPLFGRSQIWIRVNGVK